jgi:hypothetical protein
LKGLFQRREIGDESILEPLLKLVPAAFDGVRDVVEPTHYSLYRLDKQITFLVTMTTAPRD